MYFSFQPPSNVDSPATSRHPSGNISWLSSLLPPRHEPQYHQNNANHEAKELERLVRVGLLTHSLHRIRPEVAEGPRVLGLLACDVAVRSLVGIVVVFGFAALVEEWVVVERLETGLGAGGPLHANRPGDATGEEEEC